MQGLLNRKICMLSLVLEEVVLSRTKIIILVLQVQHFLEWIQMIAILRLQVATTILITLINLLLGLM